MKTKIWLILSMSLYIVLFTTENNMGHSLQLYSFSLPWVLWCVFSLFESKNDLGHSLHWNGFSLVWEWVKWIFKLLETENDLEWKWNGLSFKWILRLTTRPSVCVLTFVFMDEAYENVFKHSLQENGFFLVWDIFLYKIMKSLHYEFF